ncbi:hypothetical protein IMZ48_02470, partial [Candidatus Bathyarchaeota archaeon]|nr:hypothetical protein [Candidatus Bathyarchaeota archaeon]
PRSAHPHQRQRQHQHHSQHPPHPHPHPHPHAHQQQHQQQSLLYNASASASVSPVAASHGHFSPAPHALGSPFSHATPPAMEQHDGGMMGDELTAQEVAAREYQPRLEVCCFGFW